jgi:hypothetical protein
MAVWGGEAESADSGLGEVWSGGRRRGMVLCCCLDAGGGADGVPLWCPRRQGIWVRERAVGAQGQSGRRSKTVELGVAMEAALVVLSAGEAGRRASPGSGSRGLRIVGFGAYLYESRLDVTGAVRQLAGRGATRRWMEASRLDPSDDGCGLAGRRGSLTPGGVVAVQPPFGGGEAVSGAPCSAFDSYGSHLLVGVPKPAPFCAYPMDSGVDGRAGAKSLREADARGRCHLLGGVVMALSVLPRLEHRGKP